MSGLDVEVRGWQAGILSDQISPGVAVLKVLIVVFMLALVGSLASGAYFLLVDQGDKTKRRLLNSLGVRLGLAVGLMSLIIFGVATGQLGHRNPWDAGPTASTATDNEKP